VLAAGRAGGARDAAADAGAAGGAPLGLESLAIALAVAGVQTPHFTAQSVAVVAVLGIIGTGFAYVLNYQIITSEGATVASTVTYLLPVVAIVLGILVLGENVTAIMLAGIALVLLEVALTRRRTTSASSEHHVE
jgi:drug/metabolite transporter (DMT)-like permease